jgi:hypothetical protein
MAALDIQYAAELAARYAQQEVLDRIRAGVRHTGVERDFATGGYVAYLDGGLVAWGDTYTETDTLLREQMPRGGRG